MAVELGLKTGLVGHGNGGSHVLALAELGGEVGTKRDAVLSGDLSVDNFLSNAAIVGVSGQVVTVLDSEALVSINNHVLCLNVVLISVAAAVKVL